MRREGRLPPERAVALMRDICAGVGAAHRRQIFHRDLKPDNVIVLPPDEDRERETVKVVDFGLAKLRDQSGAPTLTQTGAVMGTAHYMSPEQCRGDQLDARSDVYSLGAVLYEMFAGTPPFTAPNFMGILTKHITEAPPPLPAEVDAPPALAALIMRTLAKHPDARPADATELSRELRGAEEAATRQREAEAQRQREEEQRRRQAEQAAQAAEEEQRRKAATVAERSKREAEDEERRRQEIERLRPVERAPAMAKETTPVPHSEMNSASVKTLARPVVAQSKRTRWAVMLTVAALVLVMVGVALTMWQTQAPAGQQASTGQQASGRQDMTNHIGMKFVWLPAGSFTMGSANGDTDERPVHQVAISEGFYMGKYEVTQAQWQAVMGNNPSSFKGANLPVEQVSWDDAVAFVARLNAQNDGYTYRLPTEAEWEYACRAGTTGDYAGDLDAMAWYDKNSGNKTHPVGSKQPNAFGLYDMHGNVWEWVQDWYHDSYAGAPTDGGAWLSGGEQKYRVLRGGSWYNHAYFLRSANRLRYTPVNRFNLLGFRVVAVART